MSSLIVGPARMSGSPRRRVEAPRCRLFHRLLEAIEAEGSGALVSLVRVEGSSPRESGARMVVRPSGGFHGTIGGGALEWQALEAAHSALAAGRGAARAADRCRSDPTLRNAAAAGSNG